MLFLGLVELLSPLVNCEIHKFKVLTLLIFIHFFVTSASCTSTQDLNLLLELVLLLPHLIDSLDQVDVVVHQSSVVLTVLLQVARQLLTIVVDVSFISVSLTCVLSILIDSGNSLFTLSFLLDPGLVEADDTALELLVVGDVLDNFKDIILELCLLELLEIQLLTSFQILLFETLVPHFKVIDNKVKVVTDASEMLYFDLHPVDHLVE